MIYILSSGLSEANRCLLDTARARCGIASQSVVTASLPSQLASNDVIVDMTDRTDIDKVHGYVINRLIPCYSPATLFYEADRSHWIDLAFHKALDLHQGRSLDAPITTYIEPKTASEVIRYLDQCHSLKRVSVDIETSPSTQEITAIAVAKSPTNVMSIPFCRQYMIDYWSVEDEVDIWLAIANLLANADVAKVFQNYIFDTMILRRTGILTTGQIDDTLIIANLLNPELPKSLADLGRIYTYAPPWKNQKDFNLLGDPRPFWQYNALDAAKTFQIYEAQLTDLKERNLNEFYETNTRPLLPLVLDACSRGMRVDVAKLAAIKTQCETMLAPIIAELGAIANPLIAGIAKVIRKRNKAKDVRGPSPKTGKEIVLEKGWDTSVTPFNPSSPDQVKEVLRLLGYRIPTYRGKETTDRQSLLKLQRKQPHKFIELLLRHSKLAKLRSSYLSLQLDGERCNYSFNIGGTRSGRFSCDATPWGNGLNIQTIPRASTDIPFKVKDIFIPDEGETFVQVDLSQAEARVVAWLANETKLIEMFDRREDIHQYSADRITELTGIKCSRQLGKRISHAAAYGMKAQKFSDSCLAEEGLVISVEDADKLLKARQRTFPMITHWQASIADQVWRTRRLVSPQGRERFFYGQYNDDMVREALSFIPQATVVDVTNQAWIQLALHSQYKKDFRVLAQLHDALFLSVKTEKLVLVCYLIDQIYGDLGVIINGYRRIIPWDIQVSSESWGALKAV